MNKIILILITLTALLTGCKSEMKQIDKIANSIVTSETTQQEKVNLNKFPSVTITLADGTQVEAQITHNNKNNLTIAFSGSNSGTAYMN